MSTNLQEQLPPYIDSLQEVIVELGRLGLVPKEAVEPLREDPQRLLPLAEALTRFSSVYVLVGEPEKSGVVERQIQENGTYTHEALEVMRLEALDDRASKELPNRKGRSFLRTTMQLDASVMKLVERIEVSQQQVVAFSERLLAEYHRFASLDPAYARRSATELRLHIAGKSDAQIQVKLGLASDRTVSQFRVRLRATLIHNYPDGVQAVRSKFLSFLSAEQRTTLLSAIPEIFSPAENQENPSDT